MEYVVGRGSDTSSSGGGTSRAAVEDPNTLRSKSYAKIIDMPGEGEWEEVCVGGLKGLYLDDVAAQNADGTNNFEGITLETRNGTLGQSRMEIASTAEASYAVGLEMKAGLPVEKAVTGTSVDYLRVVVAVPRLTWQDTSTGDLKGTTVQYKIEYNSADNSSWRLVPTATSKTTWSAGVFGTPKTGYARYQLSYTVTPSRYFDGKEYFAPCVYSIEYTLDGGSSWTVAIKEAVSAVFSSSIIIDVLASQTIDFRITEADSPSFTPVGELTQEAYTLVNRLDLGNYIEDAGLQTISGKTTSSYEKETVFRVTGDSPYTVRCTRVTDDSTSEALQNRTVFQSVSVVTEEKFRYPGSVLVGTVVDATQFTSIPTRAFRCKMLKVKVPTNYDPITREYSGFWDGSFKIAWTDNPAWCFFDLLTNTRYGLGDRIPVSYIDKASLYQIAQYCDEYVPDGQGGYEPRYTCNLYLQTQAEAYKVISDMATVFRGITYWASGNIVPVQDSQKSPVYAFTNANVSDGMFNYQSSDVNTRYNAVSVTWNDPDNMYRQAVEYVSDDDAVAALGYVNATTTAAIGCTSKGMARRVGKWLLYTNTLETDAVSFSTSLEGAIPRPGEVITITDSLRALDRRGGRVKGSTLSSVTMDNPLEFIEGTVYTISVINVDGELMDGTFTPATTETITEIVLDAPYTKAVAKDSIFVVADDNIPAQQFRVVAIQEDDSGNYVINAVSYNPSKYGFIENDERLTAVTGPSTFVGGVTDLVPTEILYSDGVSIKSKLRIDWKAPAKAVAYQVYIVAPDGVRFSSDSQKATSYEVLDTIVGAYVVSITAMDVIGNKGVTTTENVYVFGKTAPPSTPTNLAVKSYNGIGTVVWDLHPDLDVKVGGSIVIKHTTKTTGVQWEDGIVVAIAAGASTQAAVPLLAGTYTAKAVDEGGRYSSGFALALSSFASVTQTNVMATLTENPTFSGSKTNLVVESGLLKLSAVKLWDDIDLIDDVLQIDYLGVGDLNGTYLFSDVIDLTDVYTIRAFGNISGFAAAANDTINSRTTPVNTWTRFNGEIINSAKITLFVSTTNDDPYSVGAVWSSWAEFILSDYTARGFRFKVEMEVESDEQVLFVQELSVSIDAVDRVVGEDNVSVGTSGLAITFDGAFATTPAIAISIDGMQNGDYYEFSAKSAAGFSVVIKNAGVAVARQIDYVAKGYGRKIG